MRQVLPRKTFLPQCSSAALIVLIREWINKSEPFLSTEGAPFKEMYHNKRDSLALIHLWFRKDFGISSSGENEPERKEGESENTFF